MKFTRRGLHHVNAAFPDYKFEMSPNYLAHWEQSRPYVV